jgi:hypothetical protein
MNYLAKMRVGFDRPNRTHFEGGKVQKEGPEGRFYAKANPKRSQIIAPNGLETGRYPNGNGVAAQHSTLLASK